MFILSKFRIFFARFFTKLALFLFLGFSTVFAQEKAPEKPPAPPYVIDLPEKLTWVLTFEKRNKEEKKSSDKTDAPPQRFPHEIQTTKTGKVAHQAIHWSDGSKTVVYFIDGLEFYEDPKTNRVILLETDKRIESEPIPCWGFYGTRWIKPEYFSDKVNYEKQTCHHYVETSQEPGAQAREAWIDVQSKYPIAVKTRMGLVTYKYLAPPSGNITLPAAHQKVWDDYQAQLAGLARMGKK